MMRAELRELENDYDGDFAPDLDLMVRQLLDAPPMTSEQLQGVRHELRRRERRRGERIYRNLED